MSELNPASYARLVPQRPAKAPIIDIYMKDVFKIQDVPAIFEHVIPRLQHGNDGLIFTQNAVPYYPGTCEEILKWKPRHLNSIDFELKALNLPIPNVWALYSFSVAKKDPRTGGNA